MRRTLSYIAVAVLLICSGKVYSQSENYHAIDSASRVLNVWDLDKLAKTFNTRYYEPKDRLRAAFAWIAYHIDYDVAGFYHSADLYDAEFPGNMRDSVERETVYAERVAKRVLREHKAICAGYSKLFGTLCTKMGIKNREVQGWGKISVEKATTKLKANHSWNLVHIDHKWQPVDVTWAAGYTDFSKGKFHREYVDHYFLTPPHLFLIDHYPLKKEDVLLSRVPEFSDFITRPMVYRAFWNLDPSNFNASSGIYKFTDSAFIMTVKTDESIERVQVLQYPSSRQEIFYPVNNEITKAGNNYISYKDDGTLFLRYRPAKNGDKKVTVFINGIAVMEFLIGA